MSTGAPLRASAVGIEVEGLTAGYGSVSVLRSVDVTVEGGEILALLGPSGCGKTTLLRCIAGLEQPWSGSIRLGGVDVNAGRGVRAEHRQVGMVFQDGALFSHRSVLANVNYGIARGPDRDDRAREALQLVGLADKADRMPGMLSGGEQQRVALARALAPRPSVLLLDEPFSSLDATLRVQLRDEVKELLKHVGVTSVLVTHDQEEALSFGDRVAVINAGVVEQVGSPEAVYSSPATPWVAGFVGEAMLLPAELDGGRAGTALGTVTIRPLVSGAGTVMLRPEQILLGPGEDGTITRVSYLGTDTRYEVRFPAIAEPVVARIPGPPRHRLHDQVGVSVAGGLVHAWPSVSAMGEAS